MNVQQLVERLQEFPADYPVLIEQRDGNDGWIEHIAIERLNIRDTVAVVLS